MVKGISVLIPAHNEEDTIGETLEGIKCQDYEEYEVVVLDDSSDDSTPEIARENDVKLIRNEKNRGKAYTINKGVKESKYDVVCSLHADCVPEDSGWLKKMMECYDEDTATVTCATVLKEEKYRKFNIFQKLLGLGMREEEYERPEGCRSARMFDMKGDLYDKKEIEKIGYFGSDSFYQAGEDGDFALRLRETGKEIRRAPTFIYHNHGSHQQTFLDFIRKKTQYSEARGANKRKHFKEMKLGYWNEASKSLLYVSLVIPYLNLLSVIAIVSKVVYQGYSSYLNKELGKKALLVPFLAILSDLANITGFWKGFITGKQTI